MIRAPEIEALILEWYRRIQAGDMVAAADDMLSRELGFVAIGTDLSEWWKDSDRLIEGYAETARLGPPMIDVQCIEALREDNVAWVADIVVFKRPNGIAKTMRHTFVLHQEDRRWKVVHAHYSFGISEVSAAPAAA